MNDGQVSEIYWRSRLGYFLINTGSWPVATSGTTLSGEKETCTIFWESQLVVWQASLRLGSARGPDVYVFVRCDQAANLFITCVIRRQPGPGNQKFITNSLAAFGCIPQHRSGTKFVTPSWSTTICIDYLTSFVLRTCSCTIEPIGQQSCFFSC